MTEVLDSPASSRPFPSPSGHGDDNSCVNCDVVMNYMRRMVGRAPDQSSNGTCPPTASSLVRSNISSWDMRQEPIRDSRRECTRVFFRVLITISVPP